jgi:hypothetical protein
VSAVAADTSSFSGGGGAEVKREVGRVQDHERFEHVVGENPDRARAGRARDGVVGLRRQPIADDHVDDVPALPTQRTAHLTRQRRRSAALQQHDGTVQAGADQVVCLPDGLLEVVDLRRREVARKSTHQDSLSAAAIEGLSPVQGEPAYMLADAHGDLPGGGGAP